MNISIKELLDKEAVTGIYRKFEPARIAENLLQGWSFIGISKRQHEHDVYEIENYIRHLRGLPPLPPRQVIEIEVAEALKEALIGGAACGEIDQSSIKMMGGVVYFNLYGREWMITVRQMNI